MSTLVFVDPISGEESQMECLNLNQLIEYAVSLRKKGYKVKNFLD